LFRFALNVQRQPTSTQQVNPSVKLLYANSREKKKVSFFAMFLTPVVARFRGKE
jgi:hypothetical protein